MARTQADVERITEMAGLGISVDASQPDQLDSALARAANELGPIDLIVNAISAIRPPKDGSGFGGGLIAEANVDKLDGLAIPAIHQSLVFLGQGAAALRGRGGTLVQVLGAPARRASPDRGLVAAAQAAARAMTHAAALELRGQGIHVAVLIVDGIIESPKTGKGRV